MKFPRFAPALALLCTLLPLRADPPPALGMRFDPDGSAVMENRLVEITVNNRTGRFDGIRGWKYKPTGYDMVDVLYRSLDAGGGHLGGVLWDEATLGTLPGGRPESGDLYAPITSGVTPDGRALYLEQVTQAAYRITRTFIIRRDHSVVETRLKVENVDAEPRAFALRLHQVMSPGARGQYQSSNDVMLLPGKEGILKWEQNLPFDQFKARHIGVALLEGNDLPAGGIWEAHRKREGTPVLTGNWAIQTNPENGDGMALIFDASQLIGFYNHPNTTLEPFLAATSLQKGQAWETRYFFGAYGSGKGNLPVDANPLYTVVQPLALQGGKLVGRVAPMFSGQLIVRKAGNPKPLASYPAEPLKLIAIDAANVPEDWEIAALDQEGAEIGSLPASGPITLFEPTISREKPKRPVVKSGVYTDPAAKAMIAQSLAARDFVIQCDWSESEALRALTREIATRLGVGYAETPRFAGKMVAFGNPKRSTTVRNAGLLKQSVDAEWPGQGKGAILAYETFETSQKPLVLVTGSDEAGALAAAQAFYDQYVKAIPAATGFDFWAAPVSEIAMVWSRPQTSPTLDKIAIRTARNEYDSAQMVVTAYDAIDDLAVEIDPLVHAESGEPLAGKYPTSYRQRNGALRLRWAENYPLNAPEGWPGKPDALLDRPVSNLRAGQSQVLWLTTSIPLDAKPGLYRSEVRVTSRGTTRKLPVEIQVDDFTLPLLGLKNEAYMAMDLAAPLGKAIRRTELERLITVLTEHHFNIISLKDPNLFRWHFSPEGAFKGVALPSFVSNEDGTLLLDTSRFDWLVDQVDQMARGYRMEYVVAILDVIGWPETFGQFRNTFKDRYADRPERSGHPMQGYHSQEMQQLLYNHLKQRDLLDRVSIKVGDEPPGFDWWWNELTVATREVGLPFSTAFNAVDWKLAEKAFDTQFVRFKPLYQQFDPAFAKKAQAKGFEVGWYNCGPPPKISMATGASELRSYYWQAARYDLDFVSRWGVQCWGSEGVTPENVWTFTGSQYNSLIYPLHPEKPAFQEKGKGWRDVAPIESIRLQLVRDGIEDANYARLLRELIAKAREAGKTEAADRAAAVLEKIWNEMFPTLNQYNPPYDALMNARARIADAILALERELPAK